MAVAAALPRALIGARDPAFRTGLRLALVGSADCVEADDLTTTLALVERVAPDVCLLEVDQTGTGLRLTERINVAHPEIQVVLFAHTLSERDFLRAARAGAAGYLSAGVDPARLPEIVAGVLRGEPAVPRALVRRLLDEFRYLGTRRIEVRDGPVVNLTRREAEVLDLIREGLPTHAIGRWLGISDVTVRRHRASLLGKADAKSAAELMLLLSQGPQPPGVDPEAPAAPRGGGIAAGGDTAARGRPRREP